MTVRNARCNDKDIRISFRIRQPNPSGAENFIMILMCTPNTFGRWYTPNPHVVITNDIWVSISSWHRGLCPGSEETGVKWMWSGCDSLLRVSVCPARFFLKFIVKELHVGDASLQHSAPSYWVWLTLEIKQNHWSILKKKRNCFVPI